MRKREGTIRERKERALNYWTPYLAVYPAICTRGPEPIWIQDDCTVFWNPSELNAFCTPSSALLKTRTAAAHGRQISLSAEQRQPYLPEKPRLQWKSWAVSVCIFTSLVIGDALMCGHLWKNVLKVTFKQSCNISPLITETETEMDCAAPPFSLTNGNNWIITVLAQRKCYKLYKQHFLPSFSLSVAFSFP